MNDTKQPCTACDGTGRLLFRDPYSSTNSGYRPRNNLPCTVCKGHKYLRPEQPAPVQSDLLHPNGLGDA